MDVVAILFFMVSLLFGWPVLAYLFWTRNNFQEMLATWKVVVGTWLVTSALQIFFIRETTYKIPLSVLESSLREHVERTQAAFYCFAWFPILAIAIYGIAVFLRKIGD